MFVKGVEYRSGKVEYLIWIFKNYNISTVRVYVEQNSDVYFEPQGLENSRVNLQTRKCNFALKVKSSFLPVAFEFPCVDATF